MQHLGLIISISGEFRGKLKIWRTHISSVGNLQLSVEILQPPVPPTFLTHHDAVQLSIKAGAE